MANPTALDLKVPSPEFFDDYEVGGQYVPPPQAKAKNDKGKFQFVPFTAALPNAAGIETGATKDGYLKAIVKGLKLDTGYEIRETHVGTKQYNKYDKAGAVVGQRNSSPCGDMLRAAGVDPAQARPTTAEHYADLFNAIADRQVQITIDWTAYDKDAGAEIATTWEDFPVDPENPDERLPYIEKGSKRFWARAQVKRWISAI